MFKWIRKRKASPPKDVTPLLVLDDTVASWRSNAQLCESFRQQMDTVLMQKFLAVLYNTIPSGYPERGQVVNDTMAAIELGRNQGHLGVIDIIKLLQQPITKNQEVEPDYGADRNSDE